jgi:molybdopterin molybdotransferase
MISLTEARARVVERTRARRLAVEEVELADALGRRLATDHRAEGPWPTTDRSAMDGFGVALADGADEIAAGTELAVVGEALAGHPFGGAVAAGQAIRIMTGAVVPESVHAVVPVENTSGYADDAVTLNEVARRGDHIRRRGSEVVTGDLLLAAGTRVRSAEIGALAVLGLTRVPVFARPRVAILPTGDEVVPVGQEPLPHQVRDSNSHALAAQVLESGGMPIRLGPGRDEREVLLELLRRGLDEADVLLTIGGVSKGTHDLVHGCLRELGVEEVFFGVKLKPGKPTFFGEVKGRDRLVFGLPGNPASAYTVFDLLVRPALAALGGEVFAENTGRAVLGGAPFKRNWRLQAIPARLALDEQGRATAELAKVRPSGDPFSLLDGGGYALVAEDADPTAVRLAPFQGYGG